MKLIVGLGNPGPKYAGTRHNIGFAAIGRLAERWGVGPPRLEKRFESLIAETRRASKRVLLAQPQTFMNLSGRAVGAIVRFYKLEPPDVLVVCDDLALPPGVIRLRAGGSAGGQKGLADILRHLDTLEVPRLRIGVGAARDRDASAYVLSRPAPEEQALLDAALERACEAIECWLSRGIDVAMSLYNRKPPVDEHGPGPSDQGEPS